MSSQKPLIYAFIDSQNLNLSILNDIVKGSKSIYRGWKLDFKEFYIYLKDKYKVKKIYLFIGYLSTNAKLYTFLKEVGYIIIFKPTIQLLFGTHRSTKGNVDAELVMHTIIEFPDYDKAIIVTGDGDFYCLVEYLRKHNKLAHIFIPNKYRYSSLLNEFRKYFVYVSDIRQRLEFKKKSGSNLRTEP